MIARISSPFDDELDAGCTGTACGANATLGAGVLLRLLFSARGSSGNTRGCGVGALCGGGCSSGRGAGVGAGAGAAGIRESFFESSLGSVGGDLERTIRGTFSLAADGAGGAGGGWGAEELDATDGGCATSGAAVGGCIGAFWPLCASIWAIMEACASSTMFRAAMFFSSSTCPIAWFC